MKKYHKAAMATRLLSASYCNRHVEQRKDPTTLLSIVSALCVYGVLPWTSIVMFSCTVTIDEGA